MSKSLTPLFVRDVVNYIFVCFIYLFLNCFYFAGKSDDIEDDDTDESISDLLLWTIFANRKELAEIFWLKSKNHLCMCFIIDQPEFLDACAYIFCLTDIELNKSLMFSWDGCQVSDSIYLLQ